MPQQPAPPIGADVSHLMPQVGEDVSSLMGDSTKKPEDKSFWDHVTDALNELHSTNPMTYVESAKPLVNMIGHAAVAPFSTGAQKSLVDDLSALVPRNPQAAERFLEAAKKGDYATAAAHLLYTAIPYVGDRLSNAAVEGEKGNYGTMVGASLDSAGQFAVPELAARGAAAAPGMLRRGANAVLSKPPAAPLADAVAFARANDIPVDAATATGRPIVASIQKKVSDSMGGAGTAEAFKAQQSNRLATVGEQLAEKANAAPMQGPLQPGATRPNVPGPSVTPETAGLQAQNAVRGVVRDQNAAASTAYDSLRSIEEQPQHQRTVTLEKPDGPAQVPMALPVDLRALKSAASETYTRLMDEADVAPLMGQKAEAARILHRLVTGPDYVPLSVADGALGELKSFIRADNPDLRTSGQAALVDATKQLDAQVVGTARAAGPDAVKALQTGRTATKAKYIAADILDGLERGSGEPVQAFNRLTAPRDASIGQLRELATQAPEALPQIGRAVMDGLMDRATADGGFQHAAAVRSQWNKLGQETKLLLFKDPGYITNVDNFFRLAEKVAENPNPSGTARIANLFNVASAAVGYPVSKLLYSDTGSKLLTQGLTVPPSPVAVQSWLAKVRAYAAAQAATRPQLATPAGGGPPQ